MERKSLLEDSNIAKLVRQVSPGEYLFVQGDTGNTMFLILEGTVLVFRRSKTSEVLVATADAGEMLGEKAIVHASYRRTTTAQAKTAVIVVEFDQDNFKHITKRIPDFSMTMVKMLSNRLDQANQMIGILQSTNEVDRVVQYLLYFTEHHSRPLVGGGKEIAISAQDIAHSVNSSSETVEKILEMLTTKKVLLKTKTGYSVIDEQALLDQTSALKERLAA